MLTKENFNCEEVIFPSICDEDRLFISLGNLRASWPDEPKFEFRFIGFTNDYFYKRFFDAPVPKFSCIEVSLDKS